MANCHVLEKGLSSKNVRYNFGLKKINILLKLLDISEKKFPRDTYFIRDYAFSILRTYIKYHKDNNVKVKIPKIVLQKVSCIKDNSGVIELCKGEIIKKSKLDFSNLVYSRHSIRNFEKGEVSPNVILNALQLAQNSPSACNRQSCKVYLVNNSDIIRHILELQGGCLGFANSINKLLVVTSNLNCFFNAEENKLCYVEGGMTTLNVLYALHYYGLGACPLFWPNNRDKTKILRNKLGIRKNELIIMLVALGNMPDKVTVPESRRFQFTEFFNIID
jgi:nitroreductase